MKEVINNSKDNIEKFIINLEEYPVIKSILNELNTSNMNKLIEWLDTVSVNSSTDNLTNLLHQFRALLHINNQYENSNDLLLHKALDIYLDDHRNTGKESLKWSGRTTKYASWISNHKKFESLVNEYDKYSEKDRVEAYRKLVVICYNALFPFEDLDPKEALYQPQATEKIFNAVKGVKNSRKKMHFVTK